MLYSIKDVQARQVGLRKTKAEAVNEDLRWAFFSFTLRKQTSPCLISTGPCQRQLSSPALCFGLGL